MDFVDQRSTKYVFDAIHGYIELSPLAQCFVDTAEFQRQRNIKQLGTASRVFASAEHTRFQHVLGVMHIARIWVRHLRSLPQNAFITDREEELIAIAALMHDIGHAPFSHGFDQVTQTICPDHPMATHEARSCAIVRRMVQKYTIPLTPHEMDEICTMIAPEKKTKTTSWKYSIVSSTVDADRLDYLVRDARFTGCNNTFNVHRVAHIIRHSSITPDGSIVFDRRVERDIVAMLRTRAYLHDRVYQHRVAVAMNCMLVDVFTTMQDRVRHVLSNLEDFVRWDDSILDRLYDQATPQAKMILDRIARRDLYKETEHSTKDTPSSTRNARSDQRVVARWVGQGTGEVHPLCRVIYSDGASGSIGIDSPWRHWKSNVYTTQTRRDRLKDPLHPQIAGGDQDPSTNGRENTLRGD